MAGRSTGQKAVTRRARPPARSASTKRLGVFLGTWVSDGQQYDCPFGRAAKIAAVQSFEWLPDEKFLVHRFTGLVGAATAACIEIIGGASAAGGFQVQTYYQDGITATWSLGERRGAWVMATDWRMAGKTIRVTCTSAFSEGGRRMVAKWDYSAEDSPWKTFWDVTSTKVT